MEEKKRRPRLSKSDSDTPLQERTSAETPNTQENIWDINDIAPKRESTDDRRNDRDRPPYNRDNQQSGGGGYERKPWQDRNQGPSDRPYNPDRNRDSQPPGERKPWQDRNQGPSDRPYNPDRNRDSQGSGGYERTPWQDRSQGGSDRPYNPDRQGGGGGYNKPYNKSGGGFNKGGGGKKPFRKKDEFVIERKPKPHLPSGAGMPLNKYLAHCGVSSRRKAVEYVEQGQVKVNGEVKLEPYYRIKPGDIVICNSKLATVQERMVYVLLNKPKNVITTTDDEHGRATVIDIVDPHFPERLYPVGRLDRDTTGLILITNDGELAQKLSHPSFNVQKQYRIGLRKGLTEADFQLIEKGVELEDGLIEINWIRYAEDHPEHDIVELEISSGRNRIVRRIFESLGYEVFKLDRFYFAGLTKKELPRGSFRELTQREIIMLKHFTGNTAGAAVARHKDNDQDDDAIVSEEVPSTDL